MDLLWTAFLLGLVGSLHCAMMCGPLVTAVTAGQSRSSRVIYHTGRVTIYAIIGVVFGAVGQTFALAGMQRWLSIAAGVAILLGLLLSSRVALKTPVARLVLKLKTVFVRLLQRRTLAAQFALGAVNGLLPCGLVYIAAAGAATTLSPALGALHMIAFGAGTLPMLVGVTMITRRLRFLTSRAQKIIPISAVALAILLVMRGMALGIPYLSPALAAAGHGCH
jgi:uncharacterized protein